MNNSNSPLTEEQQQAFRKFEEKYFDLVWYARKAPSDNEEYWGDTTQKIKYDALNAACLVEEKYPEEIDSLKSMESGDWQHGFNSGCLAAMRYVLTTLIVEEMEDPSMPEGVDLWTWRTPYYLYTPPTPPLFRFLQNPLYDWFLGYDASLP